MNLTRGQIHQSLLRFILISFLILLSHQSIAYQPGERVWTPPPSGNFYSMVFTNMPSQPFYPPGTDVYYRGNIDGNETYWFDDSALAWSTLLSSDPPSPPGDPGGGGTNDPPAPMIPYGYSTNELWLKS